MDRLTVCQCYRYLMWYCFYGQLWVVKQLAEHIVHVLTGTPLAPLHSVGVSVIPVHADMLIAPPTLLQWLYTWLHEYLWTYCSGPLSHYSSPWILTVQVHKYSQTHRSVPQVFTVLLCEYSWTHQSGHGVLTDVLHEYSRSHCSAPQELTVQLHE